VTTQFEERPTDPSSGGSEETAKDKVVAKAGEALEQGKEKAGEVAGQARGAFARTVDQRSSELGGRIGTVAESARRMADQLREEGQAGPAGIADQTAARAERLGSYLRESDGDRLVRDVEGFARRQPWAVAAGAFVLGIMGARFLKASAERRADFDGTFTRGANGGEPVAGGTGEGLRSVGSPSLDTASPGGSVNYGG
jgi:hypothetical protein